MKEKIKKIALVGCGRISKSHIKSIIKNSERCELCAICDNNSYKLTFREALWRITASLFGEPSFEVNTDRFNKAFNKSSSFLVLVIIF